MYNFYKPLFNLLVVFLIFFSYMLAYLLSIVVFGLILAQAWLLYSNSFLNTPIFSQWLLAQAGYGTFAILILLLIGNLHSFNKTEKIHFTPSYLYFFSKPEKAIQWWLAFRFYLAFCLSIFLLYSSLQSQLTLCSIDGSLLLLSADLDWDVFIGKKIKVMNALLSTSFSKTFILVVLCFLYHLYAKKCQTLAFLQALLLVITSGFLLVANCLQFLKMTMLSFYGALLIASSLACTI